MQAHLYCIGVRARGVGVARGGSAFVNVVARETGAAVSGITGAAETTVVVRAGSVCVAVVVA